MIKEVNKYDQVLHCSDKMPAASPAEPLLISILNWHVTKQENYKKVTYAAKDLKFVQLEGDTCIHAIQRQC